MNQPILIASDGSAGSRGAIRVGLAIARKVDVPAEIVTVVSPPPPTLYGAEGAMPQGYTVLQAAQADDLRAAVTDQATEADPSGRWSVSVEVGQPARAIAELARLRNAGLIVAGTGPREALDRWLRSETSVKIIQLATVPVLLVPQLVADPPGSALVAVDFSEYSLRAAHAVIPLLTDSGRIFLAHVAWTPYEDESLPSLAEYRKTYDEGAAARLEKLAEELRSAGARHVETHLLRGDPARELVACASRFNVDVVAAGSHGQGFLDRILIGSVSARLIHGSRCSVLIAPPHLAVQDVQEGAWAIGAPERLAR